MIKKSIFVIFYFVFFVYFALASNVKNTKITADTIKVNRLESLIYCIKNVVVEEDNLKITANNMKAKYKYIEGQKENNYNLQYIQANKNVKLKTNEITATSDTAFFDMNKNIVILQNNVVLDDGTGKIYGEKLIYNTITEVAEMVGNQQKENKERVIIILDDINKTKEKYEQKK